MPGEYPGLPNFGYGAHINAGLGDVLSLLPFNTPQKQMSQKALAQLQADIEARQAETTLANTRNARESDLLGTSQRTRKIFGDLDPATMMQLMAHVQQGDIAKMELELKNKGINTGAMMDMFKLISTEKLTNKELKSRDKMSKRQNKTTRRGQDFDAIANRDNAKNQRDRTTIDALSIAPNFVDRTVNVPIDPKKPMGKGNVQTVANPDFAPFQYALSNLVSGGSSQSGQPQPPPATPSSSGASPNDLDLFRKAVMPGADSSWSGSVGLPPNAAGLGTPTPSALDAIDLNIQLPGQGALQSAPTSISNKPLSTPNPLGLGPTVNRMSSNAQRLADLSGLSHVGRAYKSAMGAGFNAVKKLPGMALRVAAATPLLNITSGTKQSVPDPDEIDFSKPDATQRLLKLLPTNFDPDSMYGVQQFGKDRQAIPGLTPNQQSIGLLYNSITNPRFEAYRRQLRRMYGDAD